MNYRHAFHAGNFADVMKHAALALLIGRLKEKPAAFRVIDTHAGVGMYDLSAEAPSRTGEWRNGIGRLFDAALDPALADLLAPYLNAVRAANPDGRLRYYPGSPWLARHLLRRQDRLTAVELHPEDVEALRANFRDDRQVRVVALDGRLALGAFVPPKERRGLVLVDPPFEERDEFAALAEGFVKAHRRWPTGIYALWYPVKDLAAIEAFRNRLAASGVRRLVAAELTVRRRDTPDAFNGAGLVLCNAPWRFADALSELLAGLVPVLAAAPSGAAWNVEELAGE